MKALDPFVGEWKGKGWQYPADSSSRVELSKAKTVNTQKDGSIRLAEQAETKHDDWSSSIKIYYDAKAKVYRGNLERQTVKGVGQLSPKRSLRVELVDAKTLRFDMGSIRTTIQLTDTGEWHETVELLSASVGPSKLQEVVLRRLK